MTIIQLNPRQLKIIDIVKENEPITSESIASILNVTRATLRSDLAILTMTGILDARPKVGYFYSGISGASLVGNKIKDKKEKEIKAYISVVVANVAKTLYSINKKEQIKIEKIKGRYISDSRSNNENNLESKIISKIYFSERINKLQQRDRYLINLKYNFDLKNRDIAKLLNMDEKLVSKKIRKIEKSIGKEDL